MVLGFDTLEQYIDPEYRKNYPYFGALIGRYGNRIKGGEITIDNKTYVLNKNEKENTLHGGTPGFDQRLWDAEQPDNEHLIRVTLVRMGRTVSPVHWTSRFVIPLKTTCSE